MNAFIKPSRNLVTLTGRAIHDFAMLRDGDRVLLGLSGGKDSLSLLHILEHFRRIAPVRFEIGAVTVDPMAGDFDPSPMIPYLAGLGVDYHYRREPIMEMAQEHMGKPSYCAFCSRIKRGIIYRTARDNGYNVIALAQHLDDLAESFLMSAFHGGQLRTMKAHYVNDDGDLRIIRPLVYVRERVTREFAQMNALPVVPDSCPACFAMPTQRQHMKQLLAQEEASNRTLFRSLLTAMRPLLTEGDMDVDVDRDAEDMRVDACG
jgi:tRNA 2-thiocytidine biosynthesis protein TtcA